MALVSKRAPVLVIAAIFLAFGLIGWAARAALAQNAKQEPAPPPLPTATAAELPAISQEGPVAPSDAAKPAPSPVPAQTPIEFAAPAAARSEPAVDSRSVLSDAPPPVAVPAPEAIARGESTSDDPEKSALAFVEQNQKMAESQLKSLKAEEAKLRERLRKVESGIKRWESLLGALKQSQGSVAIAGPANAGNWKQAEVEEPGPQHLEPVPMPVQKSKVIKSKSE